ncbi:MAG: hypothetical protein OEW60_02370 [Thiovulaceae bacterium]|nr:hypothetical protein [Sulfurimonadaceae bacterium]
MKVMTKGLISLSILAATVTAAPKPLMNPFAETMAPAPTASTQTQAAPVSAAPAPVQAAPAPVMMEEAPVESYAPTPLPDAATVKAYTQPKITKQSVTRLVVKGQGVAPSFTQSPAQAFALAKRAAMVDAYRLLGEKIQGVEVEGQDLIKNMMVKRSQVRTQVNAMIKEASIVETSFKDGLCEVEVELIITGSKWHSTLSHSFSE